MPAYDINLYAKWEPVTYTVKFDSNGGSEVVAQTGIEYGQTAGRPDDPVREDYDFLGWTLEGNPYSLFSFTNPQAGFIFSNNLISRASSSKNLNPCFSLSFLDEVFL